MANVLILKFPYSSTFGGGEKHTLTIVERLQKKHQFFLLSSCGVLLPEFTKRRWSNKKIWGGTEPVTAKSLLWFLLIWPIVWVNLMRHIITYKIKYQINIIWCLSLTEKILITPWARILGIKVIWMEHLQIERWLLSSPLRYPYVLWSRLATVVTVVEAVRTQLIHLGVAAQHTQVIYNSVDTKNFTPDTTPHDIARQFNIVFAGRLAIEKGLDDLLAAFKVIHQTIPHSKLILVGTGDYAATLRQHTHQLGLTAQVEFAGFQTDVQPYLHQADVVVLPSTRRETFGMIIAEALACAKPVLVTTTGGTKEVVGDYGWVVAPHQPMALAQALQEIYQTYPTALTKAQHGRSRVIELFNESKMITAYDALFS